VAFRYFPGKTQSWLETQLDTVLADLAGGAAIVSGGSGDANYAKSIQASAMTRRQMILHDLNILDAATYPADVVKGATRTFAAFHLRDA
jgi:hypothetical protein